MFFVNINLLVLLCDASDNAVPNAVDKVELIGVDTDGVFLVDGSVFLQNVATAKAKTCRLILANQIRQLLIDLCHISLQHLKLFLSTINSFCSVIDYF